MLKFTPDYKSRFRILKGGKISLVVSALVVSMSLVGTSASATSYFTDIAVSSGTSILVDQTTHGSDNYLRATVYSNNGSYTGNVSTTSFDNVLIDPSSFVVDNFTASLSSTIYNNDDWWETYSASTTGDSSMSELNLTFNSGANANNITKNSATMYYASPSSSYGPTTTTVSLSHSSYSSTSYIANLILMGTNTISGYTDIDDGNIEINGGATFAGTVEAGSVDIRTSSQITFNDTLDLTAGTMDALTFYNGGNVVLNNGLVGNVNFNGQNATVTLSDGDIGDVDTATNGSGTLVFATSGFSNVGIIGATAAIKEIILDGTGDIEAHGNVNANRVTYNSAGTLYVGGSLDTTRTDSSIGTVNFSEFDGELLISGGDLTAHVVTDLNNNGTVTMVNGIQSIDGSLGTSTQKIKTLNIGEYSDTTSNVDVYATTVMLNYDNSSDNNSTLTMAENKSIYSDVETTNDNYGILTLEGGTQTVTGTVGANGTSLAQVNSGAADANATFTDDVYATTVNNTDNGTSNFQGDVVATTINVNTGTLNFSGDANATTINITTGTGNFASNVNATTTNIGTGTGNFNTLGGTTASAIAFTGAGTANLYTGLTGDINFAGYDAVVNVWQSQVVDGNITTTTNNTGTVNFNGDGILNGNVGSSGSGTAEFNVNTNDEMESSNGVVVNGSIFANEINLNAGTLTLAVDQNLTETGIGNFITTTSSSEGSSGVIKLLGGTQEINGTVGTTDARIWNVYTSLSQTGTTTFNDKVYIDTLVDYNGGDVTFNDMAYVGALRVDANNSVITLNGINDSNTTNSGMNGQVQLQNTNSTVHVGNNVNLTTGLDGIMFTDANNASMVFDGNSTVNGVVGGDTAGRSTFETIYAGADGSTVTFKNDVHVLESTVAPTTFHVSGTGTVNFEGDLHGDLNFDADGIVNVSDAKSIFVTTAPLAVYTDTNNTGTLNFLGSTTVDTDIGETAKMLKAVNFGTDGDAIQSLGYNIYAVNTTIGNGTDTTALTLSAQNLTFGGDLNVSSNSTLNMVAYDATVTGTLAVGTDATLRFTVDTNDIASGISEANGLNSGSVDVSVLDIATDAKIHIDYRGSLIENGAYTLLTADSSVRDYNATEASAVGGNGLVTDNSWLINTSVSTDGNNLVLAADRTNGGTNTAEDLYVVESNTVGHFSNSAGQALAGLSASGQQSGNLATLIQRYEIDGDGVADTAETLAQEIKNLAPVANTSVIKSTLAASSLAMNTVGSRIADIRTTGSSFSSSSGQLSGISAGDNALDTAVWIKAMGAVATQDKIDQYDGYEATTTGMVIGIDETFSDSTIAGIAIAYANTAVNQQDDRAGDSSTTGTFQVIAYASREFGNAYVDASLTYANHATDANRIGALGETANADIKGTQLGAKLSIGYNYALSTSTLLTPFVNVDYSSLEQDAYTETGTLAPLSVDSVNINRGTIGGGLKLATNAVLGEITYVPEATLGAYGAFGDKNADVVAQFVGGGDTFITPTQEMHETMYTAGAGVKTLFSQTSSLMLNVNYERSGDSTFEGYSGSLTYRLNF